MQSVSRIAQGDFGFPALWNSVLGAHFHKACFFEESFKRDVCRSWWNRVATRASTNSRCTSISDLGCESSLWYLRTCKQKRLQSGHMQQNASYSRQTALSLKNADQSVAKHGRRIKTMWLATRFSTVEASPPFEFATPSPLCKFASSAKISIGYFVKLIFVSSASSPSVGVSKSHLQMDSRPGSEKSFSENLKTISSQY